MGTGNGEGAQLSPWPPTGFTDAMLLAWPSLRVAILRLWIRSSLCNYSTRLMRVKTVYTAQTWNYPPDPDTEHS